MFDQNERQIFDQICAEAANERYKALWPVLTSAQYLSSDPLAKTLADDCNTQISEIAYLLDRARKNVQRAIQVTKSKRQYYDRKLCVSISFIAYTWFGQFNTNYENFIKVNNLTDWLLFNGHRYVERKKSASENESVAPNTFYEYNKELLLFGEPTTTASIQMIYNNGRTSYSQNNNEVNTIQIHIFTVTLSNNLCTVSITCD